MRAIPDAALDLIREFEGCHLEAYHDPVGFPTQGYGRLLSRQKGADLGQWPPIDQDTADAWLAQDAAKAGRSVTRLISVPLEDGQFAALVDFVFNLGGGNLEMSALRSAVNRGEYDAAPAQFMRWVYAGKVKWPGLVRRRGSEIQAWVA